MASIPESSMWLPPSDFRRLLADVPCWDQQAGWFHWLMGYPPDCVLQDREELLGFCDWIAQNQIRSYLEIGIWTGRLLCLLHDLFRFETLAACDMGMATQHGYTIQVPAQTQCFWGSSHSWDYLQWRQQQGQFDLIFIDGDHSYAGVSQDFANCLRYPHRFIAFHDIHNQEPASSGVARFWQELSGHKLEILNPLGASGMGIGIWWA